MINCQRPLDADSVRSLPPFDLVSFHPSNRLAGCIIGSNQGTSLQCPQTNIGANSGEPPIIGIQVLLEESSQWLCIHHSTAGFVRTVIIVPKFCDGIPEKLESRFGPVNVVRGQLLPPGH